MTAYKLWWFSDVCDDKVNVQGTLGNYGRIWAVSRHWTRVGAGSRFVYSFKFCLELLFFARFQ
ncbi:unnamed protein product [Acanthoscelides obtectus]|uniref:Uncharacterized protein n=1 Tax=Acanthoscelides obtectus TaxID=200917 RepID=A0A9P0KAV0_ACAOB|nr:unnamed protein product [Acanthoscelides obtectus]CAK1628152.1 hypothetical protein AOBTE_LOCUS5054 [Acanthoscelides obtectus]